MRNPPNEQAGITAKPFAPSEVEGRKRKRASTSVGTNGEGHVPERMCILTRQKGSRQELIRLALGPDGTVAPDVRARAPGRGAWISVTRPELDAATAKGKLKAALQRAFKTNAVNIGVDLGDRIDRALRQTALDRLGMETRAGNLINGADKVEAAARSGRVHLLIHAADAADDGRRRLDQAWRAGGPSAAVDTSGGQGVIFPEGRTILSMALGRENVVHVALTDPAAAARVRHALARWRAFTGPAAGLEGGEPALRTGSAEELTKG